MSHRHSGISVEYIIAMRKDEFHLAIQHKCLGAEFLALHKFFYNILIRPGGLTHNPACLFKILCRIYPNDSTAAGGINRLEHKRQLQLCGNGIHIIVKVQSAEPRRAHTVLLVFFLHENFV